MKNLRIYRSAAFNITGAIGHVYIYSPDLKEGIGSDYFTGSTGINNNENNNYRSIPNTNRNIRKTLKKIKQYGGWNKGIYIPFINDCFIDLDGALEHANINYSTKKAGFRRIEFSRSFSVPSLSKDVKDISDEFLNSIFKNFNNTRDKIANLIIRDAKTKHLYRNKTGRLTNSIISKNQGNYTEVFSNVDYADDVIYKTNEDFIQEAVLNNKESIKNIIREDAKESIKQNNVQLKLKITEYGSKILKNQFNSIFK